MTDTPQAAPAGGSICPNCKASFTCGAKAGAARCWCFEQAPVKPSHAFSTCLCPDCLAAVAAAQTPA